MGNTMSSWPFVFAFFGLMIAWAVVNSVFYLGAYGRHGFDPYPYILLNLFLSMLAGAQAAAALIAAKGADAIASEIAIHTQKNTDDLKHFATGNRAMTAQIKLHADLLTDIQQQVASLAAQRPGPAPGEDE